MALPAHNFLSHLQFFKVGEIKVLKYGHLMRPSGAFPDKVTPNIIVGAGSLQMITNKF